MFADARAGNRDIVVGPGARSDERRIADTPFELAEGAARRCRRSEIPLAVQRHGPDGSVSDAADVDFRYADGQAVIARRVLNLRETVLARESNGASTGQQDVRGLFHYCARDAHRTFEITQCSDRAGLSRRTVHDRRVEFDVARTIGG